VLLLCGDSETAGVATDLALHALEQSFDASEKKIRNFRAVTYLYCTLVIHANYVNNTFLGAEQRTRQH